MKRVHLGISDDGKSVKAEQHQLKSAVLRKPL
jgi:hypothetical protein